MTTNAPRGLVTSRSCLALHTSPYKLLFHFITYCLYRWERSVLFLDIILNSVKSAMNNKYVNRIVCNENILVTLERDKLFIMEIIVKKK